jgi:RNA polymerase sigma factor (sigma-70 family)
MAGMKLAVKKGRQKGKRKPVFKKRKQKRKPFRINLKLSRQLESLRRKQMQELILWALKSQAGWSFTEIARRLTASGYPTSREKVGKYNYRLGIRSREEVKAIKKRAVFKHYSRASQGKNRPSLLERLLAARTPKERLERVNELALSFRSPLKNYARKKLSSLEDPRLGKTLSEEDLVNDGMIRLIERVNAFSKEELKDKAREDPQTLMQTLNMVARHEIDRTLEREARWSERARPFEEVAFEEWFPLKGFLEHEQFKLALNEAKVELLKELIGRSLTKKEARIFQARVFEGKTFKEIAQELRSTPNTMNFNFSHQLIKLIKGFKDLTRNPEKT